MSAHESGPDGRQARNLLDAARDGTVLIVGDAMLDRYVSGSVDRISPEAPVPVVRVEEERSALGGAANVAAGVVALGAGARLVSAVGDDDAGRELRALIAERGIDPGDVVADRGRRTTRKTRILARHHQMLRVDHETTAPLEGQVADLLRERALDALASADVLVLVDYDKGVLSPGLTRTLLAEAAARDVPSIVDPKLRHFFDFRDAFLFKPNVRELAAALGLERAPRDEDSLRPLMDRLGCRHLLVTLGDEGMLLVSRESQGVVRIPSRAREVFDVTGAGDTVVATLAVALVSRPGVAVAAALANVAAGIEVSRLGAVPVTRDEVLEELARRG
ncbi:MAG: PfkB family carbohydrate kinase [Gemmatimonadota bacterium]